MPQRQQLLPHGHNYCRNDMNYRRMDYNRNRMDCFNSLTSNSNILTLANYSRSRGYFVRMALNSVISRNTVRSGSFWI